MWQRGNHRESQGRARDPGGLRIRAPRSRDDVVARIQRPSPQPQRNRDDLRWRGHGRRPSPSPYITVLLRLTSGSGCNHRLIAAVAAYGDHVRRILDHTLVTCKCFPCWCHLVSRPARPGQLPMQGWCSARASRMLAPPLCLLCFSFKSLAATPPRRPHLSPRLRVALSRCGSCAFADASCYTSCSSN